MTTAELLQPAHPEPRHGAHESTSDTAARISFRQPVSTDGFIDAAWWPRSIDLTSELPPLLDVLWTAAREITRITYNYAAWNPAPDRMRIGDRTVRLGGFSTSNPLTVRLSDAWGRERIDILVIPPITNPGIAQRALLLASEPDSPYRAEEILTRAGTPTDTSPSMQS